MHRKIIKKDNKIKMFNKLGTKPLCTEPTWMLQPLPGKKCWTCRNPGKHISKQRLLQFICPEL